VLRLEVVPGDEVRGYYGKPEGAEPGLAGSHSWRRVVDSLATGLRSGKRTLDLRQGEVSGQSWWKSTSGELVTKELSLARGHHLCSEKAANSDIRGRIESPT